MSNEKEESIKIVQAKKGEALEPIKLVLKKSEVAEYEKHYGLIGSKTDKNHIGNSLKNHISRRDEPAIGSVCVKISEAKPVD